VNPARSTGVAVFAGGWAMGQLWLFWVAPLVGAVLGAALHRVVTAEGALAARGEPAPVERVPARVHA